MDDADEAFDVPVFDLAADDFVLALEAPDFADLEPEDFFLAVLEVFVVFVAFVDLVALAVLAALDDAAFLGSEAAPVPAAVFSAFFAVSAMVSVVVSAMFSPPYGFYMDNVKIISIFKISAVCGNSSDRQFECLDYTTFSGTLTSKLVLRSCESEREAAISLKRPLVWNIINIINRKIYWRSSQEFRGGEANIYAEKDGHRER